MSSFSQVQRLVTNDAATFEVILNGKTSLSSDGTSLVVGGQNPNKAVYFFTRSVSAFASGNTWTQQQKILASDEMNKFGEAVALSSDGNSLIVGDWANSSGTGSIYFFTRSGNTWTQQQKILASDATSGDRFGISVALSSDATKLIVGASRVNSNAGAAYYFTRSGNTWTQQQKFLASDGSGTSDQFGAEVTLSGDGSSLIVGAFAEDSNATTNNGAAYFFTRSGNTWTQQQKFLASDSADYENFGEIARLSSDGLTLMIGSNQVSTVRGAIYFFTRSGNTWTQQQKIMASDAANFDYFGTSVALSSDATKLAIGAHNGPSEQGRGAVYFFTRSGNTWTQEQKIMASDAANFDYFGFGVVLSSDGLTLVAVASNEYAGAGPNATDSGAIYSFGLYTSTIDESNSTVSASTAWGNGTSLSVTVPATVESGSTLTLDVPSVAALTGGGTITVESGAAISINGPTGPRTIAVSAGSELVISTEGT
jgi:hypothetical protein